MNAVFSPRVLAISEDQWRVESTRDNFQKLLLAYLDIVSRFKNTRFYLSDELMASLWSSSFLPWRANADAFNQLMPVMYRFTSACTQIPVTPCGCTQVPERTCVINNASVDQGFSRLAHSVATNDGAFSVLGTPDDAPPPTATVQFACKRHRIAVDCSVYHGLPEYVATLDLPAWCWPTGANEDSRDRFIAGMRFYSMAHLSSTGREPRTWPHVSDRFLEDLARQTAYRPKILHALTLRARFSKKEAIDSSELQDEKAPGAKGKRTGERRFRATEELRIHYHLIEDHVQYERFYGPGEHDDALP